VEPEVSDQIYEPEPPVATRLWLYEIKVVAPGRELVSTVGAGKEVKMAETVCEAFIVMNAGVDVAVMSPPNPEN